MDKQQIEALLELANAATPGEWEADLNIPVEGVRQKGVVRFPIFYGASLHMPTEENRANMQFISAARTAVPALAAQCLKLMAEVDRLRKVVAASKILLNINLHGCSSLIAEGELIKALKALEGGA